MDRVLELAVSLARGAGELARRAQAEGWDDDPPIRVDIERRLVHGITGRFRDHAVIGPGSARPDADTVWLVTPIDGQANYELGLELYGVSLAVQVDGQTVVGVVHDTVSGRTCSAAAGEGAWCEGRRLHVGAGRPLADTTVAWIGEPDPVIARLETHCGRVLHTGTPTIDWALLARGATGAVVAREPDPWSWEAGLRVAQEAGATLGRSGDVVVVGPAETVDELIGVL